MHWNNVCGQCAELLKSREACILVLPQGMQTHISGYPPQCWRPPHGRSAAAHRLPPLSRLPPRRCLASAASAAVTTPPRRLPRSAACQVTEPPPCHLAPPAASGTCHAAWTEYGIPHPRLQICLEATVGALAGRAGSAIHARYMTQRASSVQSQHIAVLRASCHLRS